MPWRMVGVKVTYWNGSRLSPLNQFRITVLETWGESNRQSVDLRGPWACAGQMWQTFPL